jgi:hypothetical protein
LGGYDRIPSGQDNHIQQSAVLFFAEHQSGT